MGACTKNSGKSGLEKAVESIRGSYKCVSMVYLGDPMDLDNDGECGTDLKKEFESFSFAKTVFDNPFFVYPASEYGVEEVFNIEVPAQSIKYNKFYKQYSLSGEYCGGFTTLHYSYFVRDNNELSFAVRNDLNHIEPSWDGDVEFDNIDIYNTHGESVVSFKDGVLTVRVVGAFYDFHTGQFVTGPVELVYERFSYAVN